MRKVAIQITGGLGNQLFQFAAGLSLVESNSDQLYVEQKLGKPRSANQLAADIFGFVWPDSVGIINVKNGRMSNFISRVTGYCLRMGVTPKKLESHVAIRKFIIFISSILLSLFLRERKNLLIGSGVGFTELKKNSLCPYLVGYFQSYIYAQSNHEYLMKARLENEGPELKELSTAARVELPMVVHLRFGDYLLEENFGIPSSKYYYEGIKNLIDKDICNSIWVFSDDIIRAKEKINFDTKLPIRWISSVDNSDVSTLQAMRFGRGYVIANSTFSWWGAYLSLSPISDVVAPNPWFMGMEDPKDLIPPHWQEFDAGYKSKH